MSIQSSLTIDAADFRELPEAPTPERDAVVNEVGCFHCGTPLRGSVCFTQGKSFCCQGCMTVFELLMDNGLADFYRFGKAAGPQPLASLAEDEFGYLDDPVLRRRLVDFSDEKVTRVTFRAPAVHCIACVWLLENLYRLKAGIGYSRVDFPRKEVFITFENSRVKLSQVVALLTSVGYRPELNSSDLEKRSPDVATRRLWLQLGVAGFAFGNIMLLAISSYLGLDAFSGPGLRKLFGYISLALAVPSVAYAGADYWRGAWRGLRQGLLTIEVPIAIGIAALAGWSVRDVLTGRGPGFFDSLCGLLFFLLCGRLFQQKTYARLSFERDYKSFFPLSILRVSKETRERVPLSSLQVGDRLVIRHGELVPADARLASGSAMIDYSFVTGEAEPVEIEAGGYIYAGGRQAGGAIEVETVKEVSQSYLTSLWNQEAMRKEKQATLSSLTNRYSQRFTKIVLAIAVGAALFWAWRDSSKAVPSFVAVLIVACPCALALAAPFALGAAQRILGRRGVYLKNPAVLETLASVNTIVFDKTGTLTVSSAGSVSFRGECLSDKEQAAIGALARHSTHPHASRLAEALGGPSDEQVVRDFSETPGSGIAGAVDGRAFLLGSSGWLASRQVRVTAAPGLQGSVAHVAIDGQYRGCYCFANFLRPQAKEMIDRLSDDYQLALLSGDNEKERARFEDLFGAAAQLRFNQTPIEKLQFIRETQGPGRTVMMVGDGLNDAGALKQSDVGVAVVEDLGAFSPASDVILSAKMAPRLAEILDFAKGSVRTVRLSFLISSLYNLVGISIAASGRLSPVVCAILMPLSSVTVVAFACGWTARLGRRLGPAAPLAEEAIV